MGIILEGINDILIDHALKVEFTTNRNWENYEAFIARMILALEIIASRVKAKRFLQLVANEVSRKYYLADKIFAKGMDSIFSLHFA